MGEAVVAEVVAERPLGQRARGRCVPVMTKSASARRSAKPLAAARGETRRRFEHPREEQLGQAFRQRHHRGEGQGRRTADEDAHPQRLPAPNRRGVVDADPAMNLVVQPDFAFVS